MKNVILGLVLFGLAVAAASAQYYFDYPTFKRLELGLAFDATKISTAGGSTYEDSWSYFLLTHVSERASIVPKSGWGVNGEAFVSLFIWPDVGVRLSVGGFFASLPNTSSFVMDWTWADQRIIHQTRDWTGTGRLTSIPLSLNLIGRATIGSILWYLTAGVTYHWNTFRADSSMGFGVTTIIDDNTRQLVDAIRVPLTIPKSSWRAVGVNVGLGTSFALSKSLSAGACVSYVFCPTKEFSWSFVYGTYDGIFYGEMKNQKFAVEDAAYVAENNALSTFRINPSRLRFGLFIVFSTGTRRY